MFSNLKRWHSSGSPWIWLNAAAVSASLIMVAGLLLALSFAFAALAFQAHQVGGWKRIGAAPSAGIILAVVTYHVIAYPVAHLLRAFFFA